MIKIIHKKRYNTRSAYAVWFKSYTAGGIDMLTETLHLKKTGEYFLHRDGDETDFRVETIAPLTYDQARAWGKRNMPDWKYSDVFQRGHAPDEKKKTLLTLPCNTVEVLRLYSQKTGCTLSEAAEYYLAAGIKSEEK